MQIRNQGSERYEWSGGGINFNAILRTVCWGLLGTAAVGVVLLGLILAF